MVKDTVIDTHHAACHPMPTYRIPQDIVVRRISRPFPYQFAPNSHAITQLCQIFENRFLNLDFLLKTVICSFPPFL